MSLIHHLVESPQCYRAIGRYDFGLEFGNYVYAVTQYAPQIFRSFSFAVLATVLALSHQLPHCILHRRQVKKQTASEGILLTLVVAPFFISFLLRTFAWKQIFSNDSLVVNVLKDIGIFGADSYIIGTNFAWFLVWFITSSRL